MKPEKKDELYFIKNVYTLKSKVIPEIHNNIIRKNGEAGGVKLVYDKKSFIVRKCNLCNTDFYIRVSLNSLKEIKVYLRPFKKDWNIKRNKLSKNKWGKKNNPLTNVWLELAFDHHNISRNIALMEREIEDHVFIKKLRNNPNRIFIISNN